MDLSSLPTVNAALNAISAAFLSAGFIAIKRKKIMFHRFSMLTAFTASTLFLISYITYHLQAGHVKFTGTGGIRTLYFLILISHSILAAAIVPLVLRTLFLALASRFEDHRRWARWTWPIWMYVSVTGVVIYWMLYRFA